MIRIKEHIVQDTPGGVRLVDYLIGLFEELPTKSSVKKSLKKGLIKVDDLPATTGIFPARGMRITLYEEENDLPKAYELPIEIIYEDKHLAVVNKPPGIPTSGNLHRTLENALIGQIDIKKESANLKWPKPVHRLDSPTSGLVVVAKSIKVRFLLGQAFENRLIKKKYHALVMGITPDNGKLSIPIDGKPAETQFKKVLAVRSLKNDYLTLLKLQPKTGRTHQLRIHCAESGFPIYGDTLYAEATIKNKGLFLAATGLSFVHPVTKESLNVEIPIPDNFHSRMKNEANRWEKYQQ